MTTWEEHKAELLADPEFRKEYERLGPTYQIISDVLRLQDLRGITYEQLAEKMGRKKAVITRLEMGNANPSLAFLQELAEALDAELTVRLEPKEQAGPRDEGKPSGPKRSKRDPQVA